MDLFLKELDMVFTQGDGPVLPVHFLKDLEQVCAGETDSAPQPEPVQGELEALAAILECVRKWCQTQVKVMAKSLPPYDPLCRPISLLGICSKAHSETAHTATLAWLMNPGESHGFGDVLARAFLNLLKADVNSLEVTSVEAERPWLIPDPKTGKESLFRTDLWLEGNFGPEGRPDDRFFGLVEAKLWTKERYRQLTDYEMIIERYPDWDRYLGFLTPHGDKPVSHDDQQWKAISFEDIGLAFRSKLDELKERPGFEVLRMYLATVLCDVLNRPKGMLDVNENPFWAYEYLNSFQN